MKKHLLFILSVLVSINYLFAQCPEGDVELQTQEDITKFSTDFPECAVIKGDLTIGNTATQDNITDLTELQKLEEIEGNLRIGYNHNLTNLNGLQNILKVQGSIDIEVNKRLESLEGLNKVRYVGDMLYISKNDKINNINAIENLDTIGALSIFDNDSLKNLNGLGDLVIEQDICISGNNALPNLVGLKDVQVGGNCSILKNAVLENLNGLQNNVIFLGSLSIRSNPSLKSLSGLENMTTLKVLDISNNENLNSLNELQKENINDLANLTSIGGFEITGNESLTSLWGLHNASFINDAPYITLIDNPQLSFCSIPSLCDFLLNVDSDYNNDKLDNATGCNSIREIKENCAGYGKIQTNIFYDVNQNKVQEANEPSLGAGGISIQPVGIDIFPNLSTGTGQYYLEAGDFTLSFNHSTLPNWFLTTDSAQYTLTLAEDTCAVIEFGIYPKEQISEMRTHINSPNNRCNDTIKFEISTINTGTTIADGLLWLQVDTLITGFEYINAPDTIIEPSQFGWYFEDLAPGGQISKNINLVIPGPPDFEIGDSLHYTSYSEYNDTNGDHLTSTFKYNAVVRCAYDPNDKLVNPQRLCDYTLFEDTLVYTIRFQNTGNDFAENVVIRDTLDLNLDLNTFTLLGSSHPAVLSTSLKDENRLATFEFENINLPDSTSNLEGSQGYVSYMILPENGLAENTTIKNSSGIYFDSNPPIFTNTTNNVLINELPNTTWCKDADMDGLGNAMEMIESCEQLMGYVSDCSDLDDTIVGITDYELSTAISIYPNPSTGSLEIVFDEASFKNAKFNIYNLAGAEVVPQNQIERKNQFYNYSYLPSGVYYINIHLGEEVFIQKKWLILK